MRPVHFWDFLKRTPPKVVSPIWTTSPRKLTHVIILHIGSIHEYQKVTAEDRAECFLSLSVFRRVSRNALFLSVFRRGSRNALSLSLFSLGETIYVVYPHSISAIIDRSVDRWMNCYDLRCASQSRRYYQYHDAKTELTTKLSIKCNIIINMLLFNFNTSTACLLLCTPASIMAAACCRWDSTHQ